ncbi:hypothetical protein [Thiomicrorhabdus cannonii]|uniref:hypothetical protein n=1 Tax=Thiomicrorhabdus cannonii TaxID=2748011 RepID=UPI0015BC83AF|nr:hypothetical protein [Thiomicrorhabdus cannonii]
MNALQPAAFADIEAPLPPGIDWSGWLQFGATVLVWVVASVLLFWLVRRYYRPWAAAWRLKRFYAVAMVGETVTKVQVWQFYAWAQRWRKQWPSVGEEAWSHSAEHFWKALNQAAFSSENVSRETYLQLVKQAQTLLQKTQQAGWKRLLGGQRWKR